MSEIVMIPRTPVSSSALASAGYDYDAREMDVEFKTSGEVYRFFDVPLATFEAMMASDSVGRYFVSSIQFDFANERVGDETPFEETEAYVSFAREHLNISYIETEAQFEVALAELEQMLRLKTPLSIDFECALESYSDKTRGCLRLIQIGVDERERGIEPKQWVIDCFRVDPTRILRVFRSKRSEKLIHYLFFEQDWTTARFGKPIERIFDSCIAWRGIQSHVSNVLKAEELRAKGENVPRAIRRSLNCEVTAEEQTFMNRREVCEHENWLIDEQVLPKVELILQQAGYDAGELNMDSNGHFTEFDDEGDPIVRSGGDRIEGKRGNVAFHSNTLACLTERFLGFKMPKTEQAGYWGKPQLSGAQIIYAALDVAVLPKIVSQTKAVMAELGPLVERNIYEERIAAAQVRVAERVMDKLAAGDYADHFDIGFAALNRAINLAELEEAWQSLRQQALSAPSFKKLKRLYGSRSKQLSSQKPKRARAPRLAGATPF